MLVDLLPDDFVLDFDVLTELLDLLELPVFPDALPDLLLEDVVLLDEVPDHYINFATTSSSFLLGLSGGSCPL